MMPAVAPASTITAVEVLRCQPETARAVAALEALAGSARHGGIHVTCSTRYRGTAPVLLVWGPGAPDRAAAMRQQVAAGGHAIALDLAYWHRERKIRISIDAPHPQAWIMRRPLPASRLTQDQPVIANRWNPDGPIMVARVGAKAQVQYGASVVSAWEDGMVAAARRQFGNRRVVVRAKAQASQVPIDRALDGAALVITWHSNVAVDAIRLGIPVVCHDGAAAAVCPSEMPNRLVPLPVTVRDQFLANLAWFQWDPTEAAACWAFLREVLA